MYKLFLTLRYLRKRRIAYFAIAAVTLCTAMVLIVASVMGGFLDTLKLKARGLLGDIVVSNPHTRGFPLYEEFIADIRQWPEIVQATPVIYGYGILRFQGSAITRTVQVVGIRLEETYDVNAFRSSLYYERFYPGTTTLAEQQQPFMGYDPEISPRAKFDDRYLRPVLPAPLREALETSRRAGIVDAETVDSVLNETLREDGLPLVPGVYAIATDQEEPRPGYFGDAWPGLILGRDLIATRESDGRYSRYERFPRGSIAVLTLAPITENASVDTPIKQPFRYTDDSRTGIYEIDSKQVYCDFALLQKLLLLHETQRADGAGTVKPRCSQIQVKTAAGVDTRALAERLQAHYRGFLRDPRFTLSPTEFELVASVDAATWEQSQAHFIAPVEKERLLITILFSIISAVSAVLVLCILYMIVLQKTRDIGIVKSIGGSSAGVAQIFIFYGLAVGVVGTVLGSFLGYWFVIRINEIQELLIWLNPDLRVWDRSVYSFDRIPNTVRTSDIIRISGMGIVFSVFGSFAAAWRAGNMQPVEALRYE